MTEQLRSKSTWKFIEEFLKNSPWEGSIYEKKIYYNHSGKLAPLW